MHSPSSQQAKNASLPPKPEASTYSVTLNGFSNASTAILERLIPIRRQRMTPIPKKITMTANASTNTSLTNYNEQDDCAVRKIRCLSFHFWCGRMEELLLDDRQQSQFLEKGSSCLLNHPITIQCHISTRTRNGMIKHTRLNPPIIEKLTVIVNPNRLELVHRSYLFRFQTSHWDCPK